MKEKKYVCFQISHRIACVLKSRLTLLRKYSELSDALLSIERPNTSQNPSDSQPTPNSDGAFGVTGQVKISTSRSTAPTLNPSAFEFFPNSLGTDFSYLAQINDVHTWQTDVTDDDFFSKPQIDENLFEVESEWSRFHALSDQHASGKESLLPSSHIGNRNAWSLVEPFHESVGSCSDASNIGITSPQESPIPHFGSDSNTAKLTRPVPGPNTYKYNPKYYNYNDTPTTGQWQEPALYQNFIQNMHPTACGPNSFDGASSMTMPQPTEDEMVNR